MPFLTLLGANWRLVSLIAVAVAIGGWITTLTVQRNNARDKAESIQLAFDQFQAKVRVDGEAAKLEVANKIAASEREKNETITTLQARLFISTRDGDKLRSAVANFGSGPMSTVPTTATESYKRAARNWTDIRGAVQTFVAETSTIAEECDRAVALRDGWLDWYQGQVKASK